MTFIQNLNRFSVKIHWSLFAVFLLIILDAFNFFLKEEWEALFLFYQFTLAYVVIFGCLAVREVVFCYIGQKNGYKTDYEVLLTPIGAISTVIDYGVTPSKKVETLTSRVKINSLFVVVFLILECSFRYTFTNLLLLMSFLVLINSVIPFFPFEGAQIIQSVLEKFFTERQASLVTYYFSIAICFFFACFFYFFYGLIIPPIVFGIFLVFSIVEIYNLV